MTGANRLLIGIGWSLIVLVAALRCAQAAARRGNSAGAPGVRCGMTLSRLTAVDMVILGAAVLILVLSWPTSPPASCSPRTS